MNFNQKKALHLILLIFWILVIFYFSNQPGDLSSSLSDNLSLLLFNNITDLLIFIVRKIAHISEFFILTILFYKVINDYVKSINKIFIISLVCAFISACLDEFHQLFVIGRECLVRDVFIDLIGILIALLIIYYFKYRKNNKFLVLN